MNTLMLLPEMESGSHPALLGTRYWPPEAMRQQTPSIVPSRRRAVAVLSLPPIAVGLIVETDDGHATAFRYSACGEHCGERRYESVEEAMRRIDAECGLELEWKEIVDEMDDGHAYAVRCALAPARRRPDE
jgi:hypothetical protein